MKSEDCRFCGSPFLRENCFTENTLQDTKLCTYTFSTDEIENGSQKGIMCSGTFV